MKDYEKMVMAYEESGGKQDVFKDSRMAHLIVHKNKVLGSHLIEGLILEVEEKDCGVDIDLKVEEGVHIIHPVHLCFGVLPKKGKQKINVNMLIENEAETSILAHCIFSNAVMIQHIMEAKITIEDNAKLRYDEVHYHGLTGGIVVNSQAMITVGKGACFITNFSLTRGRVGKLNIDYMAEVHEKGIMEMFARLCGLGEDIIKVKEKGRLLGEGSKGLIESRIAVRDNADCEVISELEASGPNARGHVDCIEIVQDQAKAKAVPLVNVLNGKAQVTHEASIGRVNQKELETLMARALDPEEAIDIIIGGLMK